LARSSCKWRFRGDARRARVNPFRRLGSERELVLLVDAHLEEPGANRDVLLLPVIQPIDEGSQLGAVARDPVTRLERVPRRLIGHAPELREERRRAVVVSC